MLEEFWKDTKLKNSRFEVYFGWRNQIWKVQAVQKQLLHKESAGTGQFKIVMAYYLPMVQYINQEVVQNLNSMPVITLNGLKGQPFRSHSALGHRVPVISTAKCHQRRLSTVLRADLNRVDGTATELKTPQLIPNFSLERVTTPE